MDTAYVAESIMIRRARAVKYQTEGLDRQARNRQRVRGSSCILSPVMLLADGHAKPSDFNARLLGNAGSRPLADLWGLIERPDRHSPVPGGLTTARFPNAVPNL
jgi:hypothetical protein